MSRVKRSVVSRKYRKKIIKMASGYYGRTNCYTIAKEKVEKALQYAYRDRRNKKRDFRSLWIIRINAGVRRLGYTYSSFMANILKQGHIINRKMLADLATNNLEVFDQFVGQVMHSQVG